MWPQGSVYRAGRGGGVCLALGVTALLLVCCALGVCGGVNVVVLSDLHWDPYLNSSQLSTCGSTSALEPDTVIEGCDSPWSLMRSAVQAAAQAAPDPWLILVPGDLLRHGVVDIAHQVEPSLVRTRTLARMQQLFAEHFPSTHPLLVSPLWALGNNDLYPRYPAPPAEGSEDPWLRATQEEWATIGLDASNGTAFADTGFYRVDVPSHQSQSKALTVLVLHTNYWATVNENTRNRQDPVHQFSWLSAQLASAAQEQRIVYVLGHIPPGVNHYPPYMSNWWPQYHDAYMRITSPYRGTVIRAELFGHEHVALTRFAASTAPSVSTLQPLFLHGAVSSVYNNYPMFRVYTVDPHQDWRLMDYADWARPVGAPDAPWKALFDSALRTYGADALDDGSMLSVLQYAPGTLRTALSNSVGGSGATRVYSSEGRSCTYEDCMAQALCGMKELEQKNIADCVAAYEAPLSRARYWFILLTAIVLVVGLLLAGAWMLVSRKRRWNATLARQANALTADWIQQDEDGLFDDDDEDDDAPFSRL